MRHLTHKPKCDRIPEAEMQFGGFLAGYLRGVIEQWLLVAPEANPAMLEMFRDRDAPPLRQLVPWAGEFAGKYLTGAVQVLRTTGDARLAAYLKDFVRRLVRLQDPDGYLGPWPRACRLTNKDSQGGRTWDTWGHYHMMLALSLWHDETGDRRALQCATRIADLLCRKYLGKRKNRLVDTGETTMNLAPVHSLAVLHRKTGRQRYLRMALQIVDEFSVQGNDGPLAGDYVRQALAGKEFFETPKPRWESLHAIMALAELYWITGNERFRAAFEQIWWSIVKGDRHNNGGFSSGERAVGNPYNPGPIESCCTIAWLALSVEMLKLTGNSVVADEIELSTLNSVVGMHSHTGRWTTYNTPMNGVRRASAHDIAFQAREGSPELNCCSVNSPRGFGLIGDWALLKDDEGFILNYYGPSKMKANLRRDLSVTLTQETQYPLAGRTLVHVEPSKTAQFAVRLRIPYWSRTTTVRVNDESVRSVTPARYLVLERPWKPGDRIEIRLDMSLHFWVGRRQCKGLASVYRGPILLAYDHRYNLQNAPKRAVVRHPAGWKPGNSMLKVPPLDARKMKARQVRGGLWLPPTLLLAFAAADGGTVHLCDFASAGKTGTPYMSWLPVGHCPPGTAFSRTNPLRSVHLQPPKTS